MCVSVVKKTIKIVFVLCFSVLYLILRHYLQW